MSKRSVLFVLSPPSGGGERLRDALMIAIDRDRGGASLMNDFTDALTSRLEIDPLAPATIDHARLAGPALRNERLQARKLLLDAANDSFPIIFYHPASIALLPFWQSVFDDTDMHASYHLVVANPLQVSDHLAQTTELDESLRLTLWTQNIVHALEYGDPQTRLVAYPALLGETRSILSKIVADISDKWVNRLDEKIDKIEGDVIEPHFSDLAYTSKDLNDHDTVPQFVKTLYTELTSGAKQIDMIDRERLLNGRDEISFLLGAMAQLTSKNRRLEAKLAGIDQTLNQLSDTNARLQSTIEQIERTRLTLISQNEGLTIRVSELTSDLETSRRSNNEQIGTLSERNEMLVRTVEDNDQALADLQKLMERNRVIGEDRERTLTTENAQLAEKMRTSEQIIKEIRRERTQDQQRFNMERVSLLKMQKQRDSDFQALLANLKTELQPAISANALATPSTDKPDPTQPVAVTINTGQSAQTDTQLRALAEQVDESERRARIVEEEKRQSEERARAAERQLLDQDAQLAEVKLDADAAREEIRALKNSTSWKISAPVRGVKTVIKSPRAAIKSLVRASAAKSSSPTPTPARNRGKAMLKAGLFTTLPFLFSRTGAYKNWRAGRQKPSAPLSPDRSSGSDPASKEKPAVSMPYTDDLTGFAPLQSRSPVIAKKARAIAFYLPQFHQVPENDEWWGNGFTEWTNVRPAKPQYQDHYQPHVPGDLGYYDLSTDEKILHRQTEIARNHGLSGFAFYFYWFAGKRLLETPLLRYLNDTSIDFPFCLCYANESWSRRWDGAEHEILIAQKHSPEDDIAFISYIAQYLRDPRYIRIDGKPVLLVYRPGLLPSARETAGRWRQWCRENGIGEIYLAYTQGFEKLPPGMFGFDAAIEFPPNNHGLMGNPNLVPPKADGFTGKVFDWRDLVKRSNHYPPANYKLMRGVNPSWDNTARRGSSGTVLLNSNPADYCHWLSNAVADTIARFNNPEERMIFINAWNEWAEGAHLEPDEKYGYAWLEATRRAIIDDQPSSTNADINGHQHVNGALSDSNDDSEVLMPIGPGNRAASGLGNATGAAKKKIIIVTHDLFRHGAQFLALNMVRTLKERFGYEVLTIAGKDGPLRSHFEHYGAVKIIEPTDTDAWTLEAITKLAMQGYRHAFVNSAASGWISPFLKRTGIEFIGLVHEMTSIIESMELESNIQQFDEHARAVVFPANIVADQGAKYLTNKKWHRPVIRPQGLYKQEVILHEDDVAIARKTIMARHRVVGAPILFLGVGFGDHRKGIDLFLTWAIETIKRKPNAHFIWLGEIAQDLRSTVDAIVNAAGAGAKQIHLPGFVSQTRDYYLAADIYVLTSREDPFPSTALEALAARTPVIMIAGSGGIEDLSPAGCVRTIANDSASSFEQSTRDWIDNADARLHAGKIGEQLVSARFGFVSYIADLLEQLGLGLPGVSTIVPGFNYENYIEKRLQSIITQSEPPREIIYLDDASTDNSLDLVRGTLANCGINYQIIANAENSGNVFGQWRKGVELATQPLTWIAEADDWADAHLIETLAPKFEDENTVLAYCESRQIDGTGKVTAPDYRYYVNDISPTKWRQSFLGRGPTEISEALSTKNTIPNVSAALIKTAPLAALLTSQINTLCKFRTTGDWFVYVNLLRDGDLWFDTAPLNYHRRHENSVTISKFDLGDLNEIADMQAYIAENFPLTDEQHQKAKRYLDHLIEHFDMRRQYSDTQLTSATNKHRQDALA